MCFWKNKLTDVMMMMISRVISNLITLALTIQYTEYGVYNTGILKLYYHSEQHNSFFTIFAKTHCNDGCTVFACLPLFSCFQLFEELNNHESSTARDQRRKS